MLLICCSQKLEPLLIELAHKLYKGEGCSEYGGGKLMNVGITGLSNSCTVLENGDNEVERENISSFMHSAGGDC